MFKYVREKNSVSTRSLVCPTMSGNSWYCSERACADIQYSKDPVLGRPALQRSGSSAPEASVSITDVWVAVPRHSCTEGDESAEPGGSRDRTDFSQPAIFIPHQTRPEIVSERWERQLLPPSGKGKGEGTDHLPSKFNQN